MRCCVFIKKVTCVSFWLDYVMPNCCRWWLIMRKYIILMHLFMLRTFILFGSSRTKIIRIYNSNAPLYAKKYYELRSASIFYTSKISSTKNFKNKMLGSILMLCYVHLQNHWEKELISVVLWGERATARVGLGSSCVDDKVCSAARYSSPYLLRPRSRMHAAICFLLTSLYVGSVIRCKVNCVWEFLKKDV
jgi:hypothetical protein